MQIKNRDCKRSQKFVKYILQAHCHLMEITHSKKKKETTVEKGEERIVKEQNEETQDLLSNNMYHISFHAT